METKPKVLIRRHRSVRENEETGVTIISMVNTIMQIVGRSYVSVAIEQGIHNYRPGDVLADSEVDALSLNRQIETTVFLGE